MSLVPCRACGHTVDTSALACPACGATDPGHTISRQQRDLRILLVEILVGVALLAGAGVLVWHTVVPLVKQMVVKPAAG